MIQPYYDDGTVQIYHGDCREVLKTLPSSAGLVLTDPPFSEKTHKGARTNRAIDDYELIKLIDFSSVDAEFIGEIFSLCGKITQRWIVATIDWRHMLYLETNPPDGLRFVRFGVFIKPNGMPQYSGDRPATGWEAIAVLHTLGGRMQWNGGGKPAVYTHNKINGKHPTEKPLPLYLELVSLYSNPGELVLDPFCGTGNSLLAAKMLGRKAIGIEMNEKWVKVAAQKCRKNAFITPEITDLAKQLVLT